MRERSRPAEASSLGRSWRRLNPDPLLAQEPLGDNTAVVKLYRSAILADDHQHMHWRGGRGIRSLASQSVHVDVALGAKPSADRTASDVFAKQKFVDFGLGYFLASGFCHHTHREITPL